MEKSGRRLSSVSNNTYPVAVLFAILMFGWILGQGRFSGVTERDGSETLGNIFDFLPGGP